MGCVALGVEVGRWYVVRAELSKAVDAAALLGAQNISNPHLDVLDLVEKIGQANFRPGIFNTVGPAEITGEVHEGGEVLVFGKTTVLNSFARALESEGTPKYEKTPVTSLGAARQRQVEIVMVLDRSGSMASMYDSSGSLVFDQPPIEDLKTAAKDFLDFFQDSQDRDQMALITFSTGVRVDHPLSHNFFDPMETVIDEMVADGWTNAEDALNQAGGPSGFSDQAGVTWTKKVQQFLVFFSDGLPTAFRIHEDIPFVRDGIAHDDAVVSPSAWSGAKLLDPFTGSSIGIQQYATGDGLPAASTACQSGNPPSGYVNTKWSILADVTYGAHTYEPLAGIDSETCGIDPLTMAGYVRAQARQMAIDHANELKAKGVKIFSVGLGTIDQSFLSAVASGPGFEFYTPNPAELTHLFQKIATNIKLRLVR